jgi:hypothetical protein
MRRKSDRLIEETAHFHRTLIDILQGKRGDLREITSRLRDAGRNLGRRESDLGIAKDYCDSMENMAELLLELGVIEQLSRRINLRKMRGEKLDKYPVGAQITGWEVKPPRKQERYFLYLDGGGVFRTSTVQECGHDYLRTFYSRYALQILEEAVMGKPKSSDAVLH